MMLVLVGLSLFMLGGCLFVTDTQLMNTDVFADQTAPVWDRPAQPLPQKPAGLGNLYQTQFHQTYGAQASQAPVSSFSTQ
ncbi:MAG TPA: hypothetical protein DDW73_25340 [Rhizobium sp.]|jgi:hypothetical protein|nr:hypothetical protein [Rhizobium sp.]